MRGVASEADAIEKIHNYLKLCQSVVGITYKQQSIELLPLRDQIDSLLYI